MGSPQSPSPHLTRENVNTFTPVLASLRWLPVNFRIHLKILLIVFRSHACPSTERCSSDDRQYSRILWPTDPCELRPHSSLMNLCVFVVLLDDSAWPRPKRGNSVRLGGENVVPHFDAVLIAWPLTRWVIRGYQSNQVSSWQQKVYWRNQSSVLNCKICKVLFLF